MSLTIIVATDRARGIGINNTLPWHLPEDLAHFRATTSGHPIIMGRKTFDSIGRPLPNRRNIVITRNPDYVAPGAEIFGSIAAAHAACPNAEKFFIIGGGELYAQSINDADSLELTEIHQAFDGDTRFPDFPRDQWQQVFRDCRHSESGLEFDFVTYVRR